MIHDVDGLHRGSAEWCWGGAITQHCCPERGRETPPQLSGRHFRMFCWPSAELVGDPPRALMRVQGPRTAMSASRTTWPTCWEPTIFDDADRSDAFGLGQRGGDDAGGAAL